MYIVPFNGFPFQKLNIRAYCGYSWGKYYQEPAICEHFATEYFIEKPKYSLKFWYQEIYQTTLAERYGIKVLYVIIPIILFWLIWCVYLIFTTEENINFISFGAFFLGVLYVWFHMTSVTAWIGKKAWWINPFAWRQIIFYHQVVHHLNQLYASQWELCLCPLIYRETKKVFSRKEVTYITHYTYYQNDKIKKLPIGELPDGRNHWFVDDFVLCVRAPDKQIPIPLDDELYGIRCLPLGVKEDLRQKIDQAVNCFFNHLS